MVDYRRAIVEHNLLGKPSAKARKLTLAMARDPLLRQSRELVLGTEPSEVLERQRFDAVRLAAAKLLEPKVVLVSLPRRTLHSADEVKTWLEEIEAVLLARVAAGPVIPG